MKPGDVDKIKDIQRNLELDISPVQGVKLLSNDVANLKAIIVPALEGQKGQKDGIQHLTPLRWVQAELEAAVERARQDYRDQAAKSGPVILDNSRSDQVQSRKRQAAKMRLQSPWLPAAFKEKSLGWHFMRILEKTGLDVEGLWVLADTYQCRFYSGEYQGDRFDKKMISDLVSKMQLDARTKARPNFPLLFEALWENQLIQHELRELCLANGGQEELDAFAEAYSKRGQGNVDVEKNSTRLEINYRRHFTATHDHFGFLRDIVDGVKTVESLIELGKKHGIATDQKQIETDIKKIRSTGALPGIFGQLYRHSAAKAEITGLGAEHRRMTQGRKGKT